MSVSIRARVTLATVVTTVVIVAVAAGTMARLAERSLRGELDRRLTTQAQLLDRTITRLVDAPLARRFLSDLELGSVLRIVDRQGVERFRLGAGPADLGPVRELDVPVTVRTAGQRWRVVTSALPALVRGRLGGGQGELLLQVGASLEPVERAAATVRRRVWLVGLVAVALGAVAAYLLAGAAIGPLKRLRRTAEAVASSGDLSVRVPATDQPPETADVATALNTMLGRIQAAAADREAALEASRAFAADVAHELRTPLASVAANVEILRDNPDLDVDVRTEILAAVDTEQARLGATLEALQLLARADLAGAPTEVIDLADLVEVSVRTARARHGHLRVTVDAPPEPVEIRGWADGLRVMIDNLLANAALHARRGENLVHVTVTLRRGATGWELTVDDDGPGLPPGDRQRLLERFQRGTTAATGTGLGLAIAAQQARVHGASLLLGDSPSGGARIQMVFPSV
jgi:two-component system sensor histidine kinase PrrB